MKIKTVLFDFGGVLYKTPNMQWMNRWKRLFGLSDDPEITEILTNPNESQLITDICLGKISEDEMWKMMAERWHVNSVLLKKLRQQVFSKSQLNRKMAKFLAKLQNNYQTGILSNAGDQTRFLMEKVFRLDRYVEDIIISAEEGVVKPDRKIYQIAMERLNAQPETTLFLDDYLKNVLGAREFGMRAVQFINNQQAILAVQDALGKDG
jgi:epoxide hydrolase-like predicted phosphatase